MNVSRKKLLVELDQSEALKEYGLRRVPKDILIQEEEHKRDIANALSDI